MDRGAWQTTVCEVTRAGHDLATKLLHNEILLSQKKHEILPFATWMDLKGIILSEISQTEKDRYSTMYK